MRCGISHNSWHLPPGKFVNSAFDVKRISLQIRAQKGIVLNPKLLFSASHKQMKTMKVFVLGSATSFGLALAIYAQTPAATPETPTASPATTATATAAPAVSPAISATPSAANQFADKIKNRVDRKLKNKGFGIRV